MPPTLLAAAGIVSEDWQLNLIAFLGMVVLFLTIWDRLKPKEKTPPDHEVYATKQELKELEDRLIANLDSATIERNTKFAELTTQVATLTSSVQHGLQELFHKLGFLEGAQNQPATVNRRRSN